MEINWSKYFDHIFILSRCSNFERRENLIKELNRIGLTNYTILYQPDSKLLNYKDSTLTETVFRCKNAHYHCIKMSYELNYDNICILEDDMVFLNDINEIEKQLEIFLLQKDNCDIYLFDYIHNNNQLTINEIYYLADFYRLNRHGMEFLIYICEEYPNLTNDALFIPGRLNGKAPYVFYIYQSQGGDGEYIDLSKEGLLPIYIKVSPVRICVQKNQITDKTNNYLKFGNIIDTSLYNL